MTKYVKTEDIIQLIDLLDRFESVLATESKRDGDNCDDLANKAAYWSDYLATAREGGQQ